MLHCTVQPRMKWKCGCRSPTCSSDLCLCRAQCTPCNTVALVVQVSVVVHSSKYSTSNRSLLHLNPPPPSPAPRPPLLQMSLTQTFAIVMQVEVAHEVDGWLQVANIHGEVGLVPSSFVRIMQPGEATPAAVGAAGAALSSAVSTGFEGLPGASYLSPHHERKHLDPSRITSSLSSSFSMQSLTEHGLLFCRSLFVSCHLTNQYPVELFLGTISKQQEGRLTLLL